MLGDGGEVNDGKLVVYPSTTAERSIEAGLVERLDHHDNPLFVCVWLIGFFRWVLGEGSTVEQGILIVFQFLEDNAEKLKQIELAGWDGNSYAAIYKYLLHRLQMDRFQPRSAQSWEANSGIQLKPLASKSIRHSSRVKPWICPDGCRNAHFVILEIRFLSMYGNIPFVAGTGRQQRPEF